MEVALTTLMIVAENFEKQLQSFRSADMRGVLTHYQRIHALMICNDVEHACDLFKSSIFMQLRNPQ